MIDKLQIAHRKVISELQFTLGNSQLQDIVKIINDYHRIYGIGFPNNNMISPEKARLMRLQRKYGDLLSDKLNNEIKDLTDLSK